MKIVSHSTPSTPFQTQLHHRKYPTRLPFVTPTYNTFLELIIWLYVTSLDLLPKLCCGNLEMQKIYRPNGNNTLFGLWNVFMNFLPNSILYPQYLICGTIHWSTFLFLLPLKPTTSLCTFTVNDRHSPMTPHCGIHTDISSPSAHTEEQHPHPISCSHRQSHCWPHDHHVPISTCGQLHPERYLLITVTQIFTWLFLFNCQPSTDKPISFHYPLPWGNIVVTTMTSSNIRWLEFPPMPWTHVLPQHQQTKS